jgi:SulP family sulfate permease
MTWIRTYSRSWLRPDLVAGVVTAAVVIPQAMAYATIAGLPVEVGLYTALVPMVVYALLGTSRPLSVSTTSTISILTASTLAIVHETEPAADLLVAASTLALLVGAFLIASSLFRLGFLANFISAPVLSGFKAGIGIVIIVGQLGKITGIPIEGGKTLSTLLQAVQSVGMAQPATMAVTVISLGLLLLLPRLSKRFPAPLAAVAFGILASGLLSLGSKGVSLVGAIPPGLPVLSPPDPSLIGILWPGALGIALMSFVESVASSQAFRRRGDRPVVANRELLALGVANLGGGLFQAYPAGGGTSQTSVNHQAGARTQAAGLITASVVVLTLLFLAPLVSLMPEATLGALVLVAAAGLVQLDTFKALGRGHPLELAWAVTAMVGVIVLGTLQGILLAVLLSMLTLIYLANHPPVYVLARKPGTDVFRRLGDHPDDETFPGLLMLRVEGALHFASIPRAAEALQALINEEGPRVIALDCRAIPGFEFTALERLTEFDENLESEGTTLWLAGLNPSAFETVQASDLGRRLGPDRMFYNMEFAVEAYGARRRT